MSGICLHFTPKSTAKSATFYLQVATTGKLVTLSETNAVLSRG